VVGLSGRRRRVRVGITDRVFYLVIGLFLLICLVVVILPLANVLSNSLSSATAVARGVVWLVPVEFTLGSYLRIIEDGQMLRGMYNSLFYTTVGTILNVTLTIMAAYPLARKTFYGRKLITIILAFTLLFSGGIVPRFLMVKSLGMVDTRWAMILPEAVLVWYVIIARTFLQNTIPQELYDAAEIDGASDVRIITSVVVPLSGPIVAVLSLFYAVVHWNRYFDALIFLKSEHLWNLQLVLRNIIMSAARLIGEEQDIGNAMLIQEQIEVMKYAVIVFAAVPIMLLYPFVQRYFIKGIMIGSLKG